MKKLFTVFAVLLVAFTINVQAQGTMAGRVISPMLYTQSDTTSISATWQNLLTVNGDGILYRVMFNSSSASKDPSVRITIDGVMDSVTEATNEEVTRYVVLSGGTMFGAGVGLNGVDEFSAVDSLNAAGIILHNGANLNLPFGSLLKIDAHCEDGTAITRVVTVYGVYQ